MGVFLVLVGPFSLNFHFHYPDEMYYTDASIQMLKNSDYFTTYLGTGDLRFKKPILTYWAVLAGYKVFGISAFSSRIVFLLAGMGLIGLTYKLAKTATGDSSVAMSSAWITAAQPLVIFSSSRSIPDILLVFFLTISAVGVTGLLKNPLTARKKYIWMFYLGLGLAFAVKGLPAIALGAVAFLYLVANPWAKISLRKILYAPALVIGMAIGLFWFVVMYLRFGGVYLDSFLEDQVGVRVGDKIPQIITHFLYGCGMLIALFIPWILLLRKRKIPSLFQTLDRNLPFFGFVAAWVVAIILMTALVSVFYERYMLPVYPLAAVAFCWLFLPKNQLETSRTAQTIAAVFVGINALFLAVGLFMNIGLGSPTYLIAHWAIGFGMVILLAGMIRRQKAGIGLVSCSILLLFFTGTLVSYPLSVPHQGVQVDDLLDEQNIPLNAQIGFIGNPHHGSKIRIGLDVDHELINLDKEASDWMEYDYLICDEDAIAKLPLENNVQIEVASQNWNPKYLIGIWESIVEGESSERKNELSKKYYFVKR
ncbi:phospholipid carrier-dependent glycosyltransferase [Lunatimonas lonarensis]|nr:glycosyltransferase family 39 protein [Lunatimonas lonarensis]